MHAFLHFIKENICSHRILPILPHAYVYLCVYNVQLCVLCGTAFWTNVVLFQLAWEMQ